MGHCQGVAVGAGTCIQPHLSPNLFSPTSSFIQYIMHVATISFCQMFVEAAGTAQRVGNYEVTSEQVAKQRMFFKQRIIWGGNIGDGYEGGMASLHFGSPPGHVEYPDSQAPKFLGLFVESEVNQGLRMTFEKREVTCKRCGEALERNAPHSNLGAITIQTKNIGSAMNPTAQPPRRRRNVRDSPPPCERNCLITARKDLEEMEIEVNKHIKNVKYYEAKLEGMPASQRGPESAVWFYLIKARDDSRKWLEDNEGVRTEKSIIA
ncbi:hypothetical protein BU16DRAFT_539985 [Lophium mytilinum]|uniref:Uncharacterized protein n=1 Tax=Lophium mytilinum TaxID=390894 RepID=A0A6A6QRF2_9PEZI|nr:hypothetical protein BU16DRAFT_539985 [Lophium mytilinum]